MALGADYDEWGTPSRVVEVYAERYGLTVDAAASDHNHKLDRYWTKAEDGLRQEWGVERVWCNPPFSDPMPWLRKARRAEVAVVLLPLWGSQPWLGYALEHSRRFDRLGRVAFEGRYGFCGVLAPWESGVFLFGRESWALERPVDLRSVENAES